MGVWWAGLDSNQRPSGYEPPALTPELPARWARSVYPCGMGALRHLAVVLVVAAAALACGPSRQAGPSQETPPPTQAVGQAAQTEQVEQAGPPSLADWLELGEGVEPIEFAWRRMTMETKGGELELGVFIADTSARRQRGLMYATGLPPANAMLFIFDDPPVHGSFWNNNVPIDLHVAFLDAEGRIMEFVTLEARSREIRRPSQPYSYALEMPAGRYAELGIVVGDRLVIEAAAIGRE